MDKKNVWSSYSKKQLTELEKLNKEYRHFLDHGTVSYTHLTLPTT